MSLIRQLGNKDQSKLLEYLRIEEALNIYFVWNIELHGVECKNYKVYGEFDEDNNYLSALICGAVGGLFYSHNRLFNDEWMKTLEHHNLTYLSGGQNIIDKVISYFKDYTVQLHFIAEATVMNEKYEESNYVIKTITTEEEFGGLYDLIEPFKEFVNRIDNKEAFLSRRKMDFDDGRSIYIEENNRMISSATVNPELTNLGLVTMVATSIEARNRGLATVLLKHFMNEYINIKHKNLVLFFDNPKAGSIYKRLGFNIVSNWTVLVKN